MTNEIIKSVETFDKHVYKIIVLAALITLASGTIVYHIAEKWSWLNSYYFSVTTLSTVGYGDFVPTTPFAKIFTTFYIFVGVGILTTFITAFMKKNGNRLKDHSAKKNDNKINTEN